MCCYSAKLPVLIVVLYSRSNAVNCVDYDRLCEAKTQKGAKAEKNYPNRLESQHQDAMSPQFRLNREGQLKIHQLEPSFRHQTIG